MRSPGQRAGLSRAAVLAAARELIAADGAGALSMRALARRLDVAPNALYSHVADKTDLLDQLLDDLLAGVETGGIETMMTSTYRALTAHPELVPLFLQRQGARGPNAIRLGEILDDLLAKAGVDDVPEARRVLIVHAIGFAAFAAADETQRTDAGFTRSLGWLLAGMTKAPTRNG
ncbi:MAG TPA: helix-turn-helix domain-containing protein [Mycobacteriales bacterium]|nr:helix-turn-helix domain-containing protein [Mycobacteriales bacterium]